jgi:hypothetical protein
MCGQSLVVMCGSNTTKGLAVYSIDGIFVYVVIVSI